MLTFQLTYDDFRRVARHSQSDQVSQLPHGFDFKGLLIQLLRRNAPVTAIRVQRLSPQEIEILRGEIAELQNLVA